MTDKILIVAAHTDDEVLGCGGAICRHIEKGDSVYAVHLTDGVGSRMQVSDEIKRRRSEAAERAADILKFKWVAGGAFPDNACDAIPLLEIVQFVEDVKHEVRPDFVYTHHGGDLNVDHRIAFQATLTAFRPQPQETVREIRSFEVASSTEWNDASSGADFAPNLFVDISGVWEQKKRALKAYNEEMRPFPHSRSIEALEALSKWRGSQVGVEHAEAFRIIRRLER